MNPFTALKQPSPFNKPISMGLLNFYTNNFKYNIVGQDTADRTATRYGLRGCSEFEPRWGKDFPHPFRPALGPPNHQYNGHRGSFSGVKRPERGVHHHPDLAPTLKGTATPLLLRCAFMACYWVNFTSSYKHNFSYVKVRRLKEFNCTNWCSLIIL